MAATRMSMQTSASARLSTLMPPLLPLLTVGATRRHRRRQQRSLVSLRPPCMNHLLVTVTVEASLQQSGGLFLFD